MNKETKLAIVIDAKNNAEKALGQVNTSLKGIQGSNEQLISSSKQVGAIASVAFAGLATFIGYSVKSASEAEVAMAKMTATLKAMGKNTPDVTKAILDASKAVVQLGFDDEEASVSITKLFQVTGNLTKAIEYNSLAMDIARAKDMGLTESTKIVALALAGNVRALKEYGIVMEEGATQTEIMTEMQKVFGGQATEASKTLSVQMQSLRETFSNLTDSIGVVFIPILKQLVESLTPVIEVVTAWVEKHPELTKWLLLAVLAVLGMVSAVTLLIPLLFALNLPMIGITLTLVALVLAIGVVAYAFWQLGKQWDFVVVGMELMIDGFANTVIGIFNWVTKGVFDMVNTAIKALNSLIQSIAKIPIIGKALKNVSIGTISAPQMATIDTKPLWDKMASPDAGRSTINISGNTFLDQNSAEKMGDLIMKKLGMSNAF